jgi:hypothetical protein
VNAGPVLGDSFVVQVEDGIPPKPVKHSPESTEEHYGDYVITYWFAAPFSDLLIYLFFFFINYYKLFLNI